jgi:hypothetical protein
MAYSAITGREIKKDMTQCKINKAPGSTSAAVVCMSITGSHWYGHPRIIALARHPSIDVTPFRLVFFALRSFSM